MFKNSQNLPFGEEESKSMGIQNAFLRIEKKTNKKTKKTK